MQAEFQYVLMLKKLILKFLISIYLKWLLRKYKYTIKMYNIEKKILVGWILQYCIAYSWVKQFLCIY